MVQCRSSERIFARFGPGFALSDEGGGGGEEILRFEVGF
jgi:hypothetical protein